MKKNKVPPSKIMDNALKVLLSDESSEDEISNASSSSPSLSTSSSDNITPASKKARIENFLDTVENYSEEEFRRHFRIRRNVANRLIEEYSSDKMKTTFGGREEIDVRAEILMAVWYLANTETYTQISNRFNVTRSSVHRVLNRSIGWMVRQSPKYIKWPSIDEMQENQKKFQKSKSFPHTIAAIDWAHIAIRPPKVGREKYYNRKKFYSLLLQGIVDADNKFIDIHCGEPGSMQDMRVFRKSSFFRKLSKDPGLILPGGVILGDSACSGIDYLVPPFKDCGNLTSEQIKFNRLHSTTRNVVKNAFGLLKGRFRRLKFFENHNLEFVVKCVVAACMLHNICCDYDYEGSVDNVEESICDAQLDDYIVECNSNTHRRDEIFKELSQGGLLN